MRFALLENKILEKSSSHSTVIFCGGFGFGDSWWVAGSFLDAENIFAFSAYWSEKFGENQLI